VSNTKKYEVTSSLDVATNSHFLTAGIRPSVKTHDTFGPSMAALGAFFREKKAKGLL
jgi:hypothetical protein